MTELKKCPHCGGESGSNARPMHPDWIRNIQRQCQEQDVPFFFKQWGEWQPIQPLYEDSDNFQDIVLSSNTLWLEGGGYYRYFDNTKNRFADLPYQPNTDAYILQKVGKKKAGCLLDGKEYKEYPRGEK